MTKGSCIETTCEIRFPAGYGQLPRKMLGTRLHHRYLYMKHHNITLKPSEWVLHDCGNHWCINIDHLYVGTPKQNYADAVRHGAINPVGETNPNAVLNEEKVRKIRRLYKTKSIAQISDKLGISQTTVYSAIKNWKHVV